MQGVDEPATNDLGSGRWRHPPPVWGVPVLALGAVVVVGVLGGPRLAAGVIVLVLVGFGATAAEDVCGRQRRHLVWETAVLVGFILLSALWWQAGVVGTASNRTRTKTHGLTETTAIDWRGRHVTAGMLVRVDLRGAQLQGADLNGLDLRGKNLRGANLSGAWLRKANLAGVPMNGEPYPV